MTLEYLAKRVGVTKQYMWDIETGRRVLSYVMAYKIADVFDMTPDQLFLNKKRK